MKIIHFNDVFLNIWSVDNNNKSTNLLKNINKFKKKYEALKNMKNVFFYSFK